MVEFKKCPVCGEVNLSTKTVIVNDKAEVELKCKACGAEYKTSCDVDGFKALTYHKLVENAYANWKIEASTKEIESKEFYCPTCGTEIPSYVEDMCFCPWCGEIINEDEDECDTEGTYCQDVLTFVALSLIRNLECKYIYLKRDKDGKVIKACATVTEYDNYDDADFDERAVRITSNFDYVDEYPDLLKIDCVKALDDMKSFVTNKLWEHDN